MQTYRKPAPAIILSIFFFSALNSEAYSAPAVGGGGSISALACYYGSTLPTVSANSYVVAQCDVNGRLVTAPLSLIFGAPIQTYPSTGVGSDTAIPSSVSTTGTSLGAIPSGASSIRFHLPPGASVSFYVASTAAASAASAALVAETRSNASSNVDTLEFSVELNGQLVFVTNYVSGTATTYTSGKPIFRFI